MLIDFHTHIFPDKIAKQTITILESKSNGMCKAFADGTENGLMGAMIAADCDLAINLPVLTSPKQFDGVMRFAMGINDKYATNKRKIISFAGIHPLCDDIKGKMRFIKENGFLGVKIHPDYQEAFIDSQGYIEILKQAKNNDLVVVTHAGVDPAYLDKPIRCTPQRVKSVIQRVSHDKFVLAHYGGHAVWQDVINNLLGLNVYLDMSTTLSFIDEESFKHILYKHGSDKILFASDCPWGDIDTDKQILLSYNLSQEIQDKIFYKNALRLLGLDKYYEHQ